MRKKLCMLLMVCLLHICLPYMAVALSMEEAAPIYGGDSEEGAVWVAEERYAQVLKDEVLDAGERFYRLKAPGNGTYHIRINTHELNLLGAKFVSVRRLPNYYQYIISGELIGDDRIISFEAQKDEEFLLEISRPYLRSEVGEYCFSVCFDDYHAVTEEYVIASYPTCAEEGEIVYTCRLCGQVGKKEAVSKLPHTLGDWKKEKDPGCTTAGLTVQRCVKCGELINQQEIPALGHGASTQSVTKTATCMETGIMSEQCTSCLEILSTHQLPITDHTPGIMQTVEPASCLLNGRGEQRCTVCNSLLSEETTTAYGHSYSEWETVVEPTKRSEGQKMRYCYRCAEVEYEKIEKLPRFLGIF